jgi:hypothetical protein
LTFTDGTHIVRVLPRADGCEVRYADTILVGNTDLALLLGYLHDDPQADHPNRFATQVGMTVDALGMNVRAVIDSMAAVGIPPAVWGVWPDGPQPPSS